MMGAKDIAGSASDVPGFTVVEAVEEIDGALSEGCSIGVLPPTGGSADEETGEGEARGGSFSSLSTSITSSE
jgi:hypothetical protein